MGQKERLIGTLRRSHDMYDSIQRDFAEVIAAINKVRGGDTNLTPIFEIAARHDVITNFVPSSAKAAAPA